MSGRLLLAVVSPVLFLLLLEGGLRLAEGRPPWEIELAPKPAGAYRVVVVGGSTALGLPVRELGFANQLESRLAHLRPGREIEVVNLGQEGSPSVFVRRLADHVVHHGETDVLVVLTAHNEFLNRAGEHSRLRELAADAVLCSATTRVLSGWLGSDRQPDPMPDRLEPVARDTPWFQRRLERYRANLESIASSAADAGVPVLFLTGPSNLADWPPVHRGIPSAADPANDAMLLYLAGQEERQRGNPEAARRLLMRARDLDPFPWRALGVQNEMIRTLADRPGVHVVDVARALERSAPDGLVGFEQIADNVHPTPLGNAIITAEITRTLGRNRLFLDAEPHAIEPGRELDRFLGAMGPMKQRKLDHARLLRSGLYCMKTPFYTFEVARRYLEAARDQIPGHWVAWANLGVLSLLTGDVETGRRELTRAASLKQEPLDPADRNAIPYLKEALERSGVAMDPSVVSSVDD